MVHGSEGGEHNLEFILDGKEHRSTMASHGSEIVTLYTATWKVAFPLNKDEPYRIFEYACHEGNYALGNMLRLGAQR